jgi:hypothetical protein
MAGKFENENEKVNKGSDYSQEQGPHPRKNELS